MKKTAFILLFGCAVRSLFAFQTNPCSEGKTRSALRKSRISSSQQAMEDKYDVRFEHLNLDVERDTTYISGWVRTIATVTSSTLDTFAFELHPALQIDSVLMNGIKAPFLRSGNYTGAAFPASAASGSVIDARIYYHGTPPSNLASALGDGFSNAASPTWGNKATWSLSESFAAYEWWPCKQSLRDKIDSSWFFITTDTSNKAGSNGLVQQVIVLPNGKARYEWKNNTPIDYYLISVSVAQYVEYNLYAYPVNIPKPVLIQNYVYNNPATLGNFKSVIDQTKDFIELFSKLFGPYPFPDQKYGHCMAPIGGGMEHQTMTTLGSFDFTLVSHELAHQWFGDHVTCKTWSDIFVNESFASYSEYLAFQYLDPLNAASHMLNQHSSIMSRPGGSVWFTDSNNTARIFDSRLSYDKGSAMLHWIRFELNNDTVFFHVLQSYQKQFANSTATAIDFKTVLETVSGMDFTDLYNEIFYGEGYPTFSVRWNQLADMFVLVSNETVSMPSITPLFKTPVEFRLSRPAGDTVIRVMQLHPSDTFRIRLSGTVTAVTADPANWIFNRTGTNVHDPAFTGIAGESIIKPEFIVYPNPAFESLHLRLPGRGKFDIKLFDVSGKILFSYPGSNRDLIDISQLKPGVYSLKINSVGEAAEQELKFVKE